MRGTMKKKRENRVGVYKAICDKSPFLMIFLFFSMLIFQSNLRGQLDDIKFEQISIEQGLSQGTAFCIIQDEMGFLWIGTQHGLNRYDGHTFKVYNHDPRNPESLSHDYVLTICEDLNGILWIGTEGGGFNKFDRKTEKFSNFKNDPGNTKTLSNNNVRAIYADESGTLWIGTDEGVNKFDRNANEFSQYLIEERINTILQDKSGILWVGTDKGLYYYNQENDNFDADKCKKKPIGGESIPQKIKVIYEDMDGVFWLGTDLGLFIREKDASIHDMRNIAVNPEELKDKQISSIARDLTGKLWIGTQSNGLFIFDPKEKKLIPFCNKKDVPDSLSHNFVKSIYVDKDGLVWIGTDGGGINKFDPKRKKFNLYRNIPEDPTSLSKDDVMSICTGKNGVIWIGTLGNGFDRFNSKKNEKKFYHFNIPFEVSNNPNRDQITAICEDHNGIVWLGTKEAGLYGFNPKEKSFKHYKEHIKENADIVCIYVDGENVLWIGEMDGGLIRIDEDRKEFKCYKTAPGNLKSLSNDKVLSICDGSPGILWVGTGGGGLNKFDKENEQFTRYQPEPGKPDSLSHNFIISIYKDSAGTLWIGTKGGINRFDVKNETFTAYSNQDGLPSNVIYAILKDDDGNLWLSTNRGLSRFNPESKEFRNYTVRDGLQGYEFNLCAACKSDQGEMFFGGINGFNSFFSKEISDNQRKSPPPVVFTTFKMRGQESKLNYSNGNPDPLELSYKDDFISFEFAALSFSEPGKNQYAYKLEPVHKEWIQLGNKRDVDLINLAPGNYNLRVKGSNSDGFWNEEGTGIKITVSPPYWKTPWFYLCLLLFVGGIIGWPINNIINTNRRLQKEIHERLQAEEKLRESEELYRTLIDTSPDAIVLYDSDMKNGKIVKANQQAAVLLGYTYVDEMLASVKNIFDHVDVNDLEKTRKNIDEIIKGTGFNKNTEYLMRTKDGTPIPVEINTSLIKDTDGNPRYLLSIARDISKRKEAEKKEKLDREKLIQVERMASLGRLLSGVAHELNNPVASIKMNSEIFDRVWKDIVPVLDRYYRDKTDFSMAGIPYPDAKKRLEELIIGSMEGSQRIEKIIHDLRDFSRPGDNYTDERIDMNKVISSSIDLTNNLIKKNTKNFSEKLAQNLPFIKGNFQKLEQVFINLIQNACQALPDNDKYISISSNYNKANKHVVVTVKDGGVGIDENDLPYITDPFFTTRRDQGGTGMGLSISMQIIREHNGNMKVQSEKGKGTTVTVSFPVND
jgi:PAS domain S-box-containing protein